MEVIETSAKTGANINKVFTKLTELILENYKSILFKKNNEINNLTSKCQEFKDNLDQYEKDRDNKLESFNKEKNKDKEISNDDDLVFNFKLFNDTSHLKEINKIE